MGSLFSDKREPYGFAANASTVKRGLFRLNKVTEKYTKRIFFPIYSKMELPPAENICRRELTHSDKSCSALRAAACSASFLLWPEPEPMGTPFKSTSAAKVFAWSGPRSPTMR